MYKGTYAAPRRGSESAAPHPNFDRYPRHDKNIWSMKTYALLYSAHFSIALNGIVKIMFTIFGANLTTPETNDEGE